MAVTIDNKTYETSPIISIANQSYATYLKNIDNLEEIFDGKTVGIDLKSYITNRCYYAVAINAHNDRDAMVVDQQLVLTIAWD